MKNTLRTLLENGMPTAQYVMAHYSWQRQRGRRPSVAYRGERNPRKALALALKEWRQTLVTNVLGLNLEVMNDDIVPIAGSLYVKTPQALKRLFVALRKYGYEIDNLREAGYRRRDGVTVEGMERENWSLWSAHLNLRYGKCDNCGSYISTAGIQSHGHRCEVCGNVTYRHIVKGSRVRFAFRDEIEQQSMFSPQLAMTVYRYDPERGYIYFEEGFHEGGFCTVVNQRASEYMKHHRGKWQKVTAWGKNLIRVRYHPRFDNDLRDMVFVYDVYKHAWGAKIVRLWNGREYSEWDRLPVPESISIHETWHWKHLPKSPTLHVRILHACGQTDDKGWHYQDGRPWFRPGHWENMARFIRHFTQLDADAFDRAWPRFPSDGPGGIDALARWCHESPVVTNEPNVGNLLVALGKAFEGRRLTDGEVKAAMLGLEDPSARELFM